MNRKLASLGQDSAVAADALEEGQGGSESAYSVRSLSRGLSILRCFDIDHVEWGVTELGKRLGLNKATVYRLVKTLEAESFLTLDQSTGKYRLGPMLLRVSYVGLSNLELVKVAQPHMERLAAAVRETVDLTVWTDEGALFVAQVLTSRPFKPVASVGRTFTDYANSHSKVFLAFMDERKRAALLTKAQPQLTPYTITAPERLTEILRQVAAEGVAYDFQEQAEGVSGVAVPIFGPFGGVVASIAVVVPSSRFGASEGAMHAERLKETATAISRDLGYKID